MVSISKGPLAVACNSIPCNTQCSLFSNALFGVVVSEFVPVGSDINSFLVHHLEQLMLKDLNSWLAKPNVLMSC